MAKSSSIGSSSILCPNCFRSNDFRAGPAFNCHACNTLLQWVACPHCHRNKISQKGEPWMEGLLNRCDFCSKFFRFFYCDRCVKIQYWTPKDPRTVALRQNCVLCRQSVEYVHCRSCQHYLVDPPTGALLGGQFFCRSCLDQARTVRCPHCSANDQDENLSEHLPKTMRCRRCQKKFLSLRCRHCERVNSWTKIETDLFNVKCLFCRQIIDEKKERPSVRRSRESQPTVPRLVERSKSRRAERNLCRYFEECREFVKELGWSNNFFNPKFDKCYCSHCYSSSQPNEHRSTTTSST